VMGGRWRRERRRRRKLRDDRDRRRGQRGRGVGELRGRFLAERGENRLFRDCDRRWIGQGNGSTRPLDAALLHGDDGRIGTAASFHFDRGGARVERTKETRGFVRYRFFFGPQQHRSSILRRRVHRDEVRDVGRGRGEAVFRQDAGRAIGPEAGARDRYVRFRADRLALAGRLQSGAEPPTTGTARQATEERGAAAPQQSPVHRFQCQFFDIGDKPHRHRGDSGRRVERADGGDQEAAGVGRRRTAFRRSHISEGAAAESGDRSSG